MKKFLALILAGALLTGCGATVNKQSPDFYPNEQFARGGYERAEAAARRCMALADYHVRDPHKGGEILQDTLVNAVVGAGAGALGGVIMKGNVGRATGAGAAIAGVVGLVDGLSKITEHSPAYVRFVEHCLHKEGYEVIGWSTK